MKLRNSNYLIRLPRSARLALALLSTLLLALLVAPSVPVAAAENVGKLPAVNGFTSARFDLLSTVTVNGQQQVAFGQGAVILPGKSLVWIGMNQTSVRTGVVQVDSNIYINDGTGWKRTQNAPIDGIQSLPVAEQLATLSNNASSVVKIADTTLRNVAVTQYQVGVSGDKVLELSGSGSLSPELQDLIKNSTYKYDFWIGTQDGQLYQQSTFVGTPATTIEGQAVPATETNSLLTYRDFNDPSISIVAPI